MFLYRATQHGADVSLKILLYILSIKKKTPGRTQHRYKILYRRVRAF